MGLIMNITMGGVCMSKRIHVLLLLMFMSLPVAAKKTLFAAMDDWPPFIIDTNSLSSDSGFDGIDRELLQELSSRTGIDIYLLRYPFMRALQDMQGGRVDLLTSLAKTPARSRYIGYLSTPYYQCHPAFYGLPALAKQVRRYADLKGKTIGYVRGSVYFEPFDSDASLHKNAVLNESQLPGKLLKQRNDLFIGTDCQVSYALHEMGLSQQIVATTYQPDHNVDLYIGYSKAAGIEQEVALLDKALAEMIAEGWVARLVNSYFYSSGHPHPDVRSVPSASSATNTAP